MHFVIDFQCKNTRFLRSVSQKTCVFTVQIDAEVHFVEAKSLFLLLKSHKFFISAYIKNVDFASTKCRPRPIYTVKSRGSCSALYKNLDFSRSESMSKCVLSRRNQHFQSNGFSSSVVHCCSSSC